jgi:hypothetical protein
MNSEEFKYYVGNLIRSNENVKEDFENLEKCYEELPYKESSFLLLVSILTPTALIVSLTEASLFTVAFLIFAMISNAILYRYIEEKISRKLVKKHLNFFQLLNKKKNIEKYIKRMSSIRIKVKNSKTPLIKYKFFKLLGKFSTYKEFVNYYSKKSMSTEYLAKDLVDKYSQIKKNYLEDLSDVLLEHSNYNNSMREIFMNCYKNGYEAENKLLNENKILLEKTTKNRIGEMDLINEKLIKNKEKINFIKL